MILRSCERGCSHSLELISARIATIRPNSVRIHGTIRFDGQLIDFDRIISELISDQILDVIDQKCFKFFKDG